MKRSGTADLPLHKGRAPKWLFKKMKRLSKVISEVIIDEYSQSELLHRLSDPYWFQSLGCVVGFDWHSSGLTTTLTGAIKESLNEEEHGIKVAGGKGKSSRKAPKEILESDLCNYSKLKEIEKTSKISAKVDTNCVQDTYDLYHHVLIFTENGEWAVIQQGMNTKNKYARRYHWISNEVDNFVNEPHKAISTQKKKNKVLNLTSQLSKETRKTAVDLVNDDPSHLQKYLKPREQKSVFNYLDSDSKNNVLMMPDHHHVDTTDLTKRTLNNLEKAYERNPNNFKELVSVKGVGKKSLRALALISELVYGTENDWNDPAKYSFAHGGKDGYPEPVNMERYEKSISFLENILERSEIERKEKYECFKKLRKLKDVKN